VRDDKEVGPMRSAVALFVLGFPTCLFAAEVDRARLRQAACLPVIEAMIDLRVDEEGFHVPGDTPDVRPEIDKLLRALTGDASDAERYHLLANLYARQKDTSREQEARKKAIELYRQQLRAQPNNGRLMGQLGTALEQSGVFSEAETLDREAVKASPEDADVWINLGWFLNQKGIRTLREAAGKSCNAAEALELAKEGHLSPQAAEQAAKCFDEAAPCLDKAVACAPKSTKPYVQRAGSRLFRAEWTNTIRFLRIEPLDAFPQRFSSGLADIRKAVELAPDDSKIVCLGATWEIFAAMESAHLYSTFELPRLWQAIPEEARRSIRESSERLRKFDQAKDVHDAASALELLGIIQLIVMHDAANGVVSLRRSLELDPSRDEVWDTVISVTDTILERPRDALAIAKEWLGHGDRADKRYILAKVYAQLDQLGEAEEQLRAALKLEPKHLQAQVGLAVLFLKRGDDQSLAETGRLLDKAAELVTDATPARQRLDYSATRGIYQALTGHPDEGARMLKAVLQLDGNHRSARPALDVLEH
jgi:Tfp pilus assembly protein PilF